MISQASEQGHGVTKIAKRPVFKKPSWVVTQSGGDGSAGDLFRRSAQTYVGLSAEAERERKPRAKKREVARNHTDVSSNHTCKKRRLSGDLEDGGNDEYSQTEGSDYRSGLCADVAACRREEPATLISDMKAHKSFEKSSLANQYEKSVAAVKMKAIRNTSLQPADIVDLEDDSDEHCDEFKTAVAEGKALDSMFESRSEEDGLRDEEFPELARKAREKARRKRLEEVLSQSAGSSLPALVEDSFSSSHLSPVMPSLPPQDPVLHILITSAIEGTQSLIVSRKLSQRLKDVRLAWAERQGFSKEFIETIFLTWRGKRLFDVTSCKSLGIGVNASGQVVLKSDVLGDEEGRLHMEAVTPALFEASKKAKQDAKVVEQTEDGVDETIATLTPKPEPQVRIILKGKGYEDFKLIVKPVSDHQLCCVLTDLSFR